MKVEIKKTGINGEGIGYIAKKPVFVNHALVNEVVDVEITKDEPRYSIAQCKKVIKASKSRVEPKCKTYRKCQGCSLMIAEYGAQLQYKREILKQTLIKYAQIDPRKIGKVSGSMHQFGYRNQFKLPVGINQEGKLCTGFYQPNSNIFVEIKHCVIHEKELEYKRKQILTVLNKHRVKSYSSRLKKGLRSLIVRGLNDEYQCTLVGGHDDYSDELIQDLLAINGLVSVWQSVNTSKHSVEIFGKVMKHLGGKKRLSFEFCDMKLELLPRSFFQLNTSQAKRLYQYVKSLVNQPKQLIVEAYSGIGAISLMLRNQGEQIIGIEYIQDAVTNANENAKRNEVSNVSFICDDAGKRLEKISKKQAIDLLIVDPPRSGLDDTMLECIIKSKINEVIYVSCNPATLGKNLAVLKEYYDVESIQPFDMFPNTQHVETVCHMVRK